MEIIDDPDGERLSTWVMTHVEDLAGSCANAALYVDSVLFEDADGEEE